MEFLANQADTPKAILTFCTIFTAHQVVARHTAHTLDEMGTLMAVNTIGRLGTIGAPLTTNDVIAPVTIGAIRTKHALAAVGTLCRFERFWISAFSKRSAEYIQFRLEGSYIHTDLITSSDC